METKTRSTVVAVFKSRSDAEAAMQDLRSSGFTNDEIFLSTDDSTSGRAEYRDVSGTETHWHHEGGIKGWFKSLFGEDEESDRPYYERAVNTGNILLSVDTTDENIDRAADIPDGSSDSEWIGTGALRRNVGGRCALWLADNAPRGAGVARGAGTQASPSQVPPAD